MSFPHQLFRPWEVYDIKFRIKTEDVFRDTVNCRKLPTLKPKKHGGGRWLPPLVVVINKHSEDLKTKRDRVL